MVSFIELAQLKEKPLLSVAIEVKSDIMQFDIGYMKQVSMLVKFFIVTWSHLGLTLLYIFLDLAFYSRCWPFCNKWEIRKSNNFTSLQKLCDSKGLAGKSFSNILANPLKKILIFVLLLSSPYDLRRICFLEILYDFFFFFEMFHHLVNIRFSLILNTYYIISS